MVERMETNLKRDVIKEVRAGNGRVLLHDEVEERPGSFAIVPIWETVTEEDIMTPRDVFDLMGREGYRIDYGRVAIVRDLAHRSSVSIPDASTSDGRTGATARCTSATLRPRSIAI